MQQLLVHLVNLVHEEFRGRKGQAMMRRADVALALIHQQDPVPLQRR